jgi:hypothetical protein
MITCRCCFTFQQPSVVAYASAGGKVIPLYNFLFALASLLRAFGHKEEHGKEA